MKTKPSDGQLKKKMFLDMPNAAKLAGFSIKHFNRIIKEENIPILEIRHKYFILGRDFESWKNSKKIPKAKGRPRTRKLNHSPG